MSVPGSAPAPFWLAVLAGSMAGSLFLLPRLASLVPFLALPLGIAGLFSALPLMVARISGRFAHAGIAAAAATLFVSLLDSPAAGMGFAFLFGLWGLVAAEVTARRKSVIMGCAMGFAVLSVEALYANFSEGTAALEATLRSPQVQTAFDQWAAQVPLEAQEAKVTIERVRSGIVALYPSLSVVSAAAIVALNAIALGRFVHRSRIPGFPKDELGLLRWPFGLVIAFVLSGALLLAPSLKTAAWNGLIVTLFLFLLQGLSVISFGLARLFPSELMRTLLLMASLLGPWAVLVSLLGLFDQWFDFRSRFVKSEAPPAPPN